MPTGELEYAIVTRFLQNLQTALRQGLRVVPISPDGRMPASLDALRASAPSGFEPPIGSPDAERAAVLAAALARLQRTPREQLDWLRSLAAFQNLRGHLNREHAS